MEPAARLTVPSPIDAMGYHPRLPRRLGGTERSGSSLERRAPSRRERGGVLIVCGRNSHPYLAGLLRQLQLAERVTLVVCPTEDSSAIVERGVRACVADGPFRRFYAVVCYDDQEPAGLPDPHPPDMRAIKYSIRYKKIVSIPSFELWLLLHWQELLPGQWSDYAQLSTWIQGRLATHLPPALQNDPDGLFASMSHGVAKAISRGQRLARSLERSSAVWPVTNLHELVSYLLKLHEGSQRLQD
ncbi:MAG: RloB family protein [Magnetococcus sp. MYC-9]